MECTLVFPHQLFRSHPAVKPGRDVVLVEEWLFFRQYRFHQQKIILHRASMQAFRDRLENAGFRVWYVNSHEKENDVRFLVPELQKRGYREIHMADPVDHWLLERTRKSAGASGLTLTTYPSPGFLNTGAELQAYIQGKKTYFQTDFYIDQRKKRKILLDGQSRPRGGQWTYDMDNRKRFPKQAVAPAIVFPKSDRYLLEARQYARTHFEHHYGCIEPPFADTYPWAWNHEDARVMLEQFVSERLASFGDYEDAMVEKEHFLFHSVLTPMLNIGLLEPADLVHAALEQDEKHRLPLNALEGFIRQVTGWREFIRMVYEQQGTFQRTRNYWGFNRRIPMAFWEGNTGIGPVDAVIRKVLKTGYSHHIERLMVMGNFFLLCEFDPDEVYRWFMEMYVDAYDWVMVPNVYGMTQFADGGLMTTKPYISGSNYLMKMGDWKPSIVAATGKTWAETWDGLFWRFMHQHRSFFGQNPRLGMLLGTFDRMPDAKKQQHLENAQAYLMWLDEDRP
jgi:deoxyribodipyrimidine photolyase-related protein